MYVDIRKKEREGVVSWEPKKNSLKSKVKIVKFFAGTETEESGSLRESVQLA